MEQPSGDHRHTAGRGYVPGCAGCRTESNRKHKGWRDRNRDRINARKALRSAEVRATLAAYKLGSGCDDCGLVPTHPEVLEFDHVRGEKRFNLSSAKAMQAGYDTIWAEVEKCEVVCANCHRIRTARRRRGIA